MYVVTIRSWRGNEEVLVVFAGVAAPMQRGAAVQAHPQDAGVQQYGCMALANVCSGSDVAARARRQRAVTAGATEAAVGAMRAHPGDAAVQRQGQGLRDLLA